MLQCSHMSPDEGSVIGAIMMQKVEDLAKRVDSLERHHKKWMLSPNLFKRSISGFLNTVFISALIALIVRGTIYLLYYLDSVQL